MKIDIAKLPVVEAVVGFFIVVIIVTFIGAFAATGSGADEAVSGSPTPGETPQDVGTPSPDGDGAAPIPVTLNDNSFDPEEITVPAGSTVTFDITNDGGAIHNMHIAGPEGDFTEDFCDGSADPCSDPDRVRGGDKASLNWEVPDTPGEVNFRCDFHPQQMTGKVTIE